MWEKGTCFYSIESGKNTYQNTKTRSYAKEVG